MGEISQTKTSIECSLYSPNPAAAGPLSPNALALFLVYTGSKVLIESHSGTQDELDLPSWNDTSTLAPPGAAGAMTTHTNTHNLLVVFISIFI